MFKKLNKRSDIEVARHEIKAQSFLCNTSNINTIIKVGLSIATVFLATDQAYAWKAPDVDGGFKAGFTPLVKLLSDYSMVGVGTAAIAGIFAVHSQGGDLKAKGMGAFGGALVGAMSIWGITKGTGLDTFIAP